MSGLERARLLGLLGEQRIGTVVMQRTDLHARPTDGPVRVVQSAPREVTDPLGESIRRMTERSHVRAIDRDSRHMRGFDSWMRGARR